MSNTDQPPSVQLNAKLQQHPALVASLLKHDEERVGGFPDDDQRWRGWYSYANSQKIYGQIQTKKLAARESAAELMLNWINTNYRCQ